MKSKPKTENTVVLKLFILLTFGLMLGLLDGYTNSESQNIVIKEGATFADEETEITFRSYKADALNLTAIEHTISSYMQEPPPV